jgi:hypothetical protein
MVLLAQPGNGTQGATVTNANASGGNQFDTVTKSGTGTTQTYDNAHIIHSNTTSLKNHIAAVSSTAFYQWKASITATNNAYGRIYIYVTANPSVNARIMQFNSGSNVAAAGLVLTTTGTIRTVNALGSTIATSTATVALNAWNRIELEVTGVSGSTGTVAARLYSGANLETATPDTGGTLSNAAQNVTGQVNDFRVGIVLALNATRCQRRSGRTPQPRASSPPHRA